jgi:hypothetical protein
MNIQEISRLETWSIDKKMLRGLGHALKTADIGDIFRGFPKKGRQLTVTNVVFEYYHYN